MEVQAIMLLIFFMTPRKRVKDKMMANWLNKETFSMRIENRIKEKTYFLLQKFGILNKAMTKLYSLSNKVYNAYKLLI